LWAAYLVAGDTGHQPLGFAGLGRMGRPVCANLVRDGYVVTAADVRAELVTMVAGWGAQWGAHMMRWRRRQKP